ncbi:S8 family serine peptidase [Pseudomonas sp. UFMG81]|uniref:S8 family serine peptidase n=1 Tax=Pseudomonas sp. UFMG81 TaxID=2745936 RepID=UPI00188E5463|nr:S8 family serine peptidase [Pseudomonas sp. UFMG81]
MDNDLSFLHYRNFSFDRFLFVRCMGVDLGKVKHVRYVLRKIEGGKPRRLDDHIARAQADSGALADYGCPVTFRTTDLDGQFSVTPTVTWLDSVGGGSQAFAPLLFDIQPGESNRKILDKVPLDGSIARRKREAPGAGGKLPAAFELHQGPLVGHTEINRRPALGPLLVKFAAGGAERFAADLQAPSDSAVLRLWPGLASIIHWQACFEQAAGSEALAGYYRIEQPSSMLNDTFIALGRSLAGLDYVEGVHLQPDAESDPYVFLAAAAGLATLLTGTAVVLGNRAEENARPTSDYEHLQTYLDAPGPQTKGLNIRRAWAQDVKGKGGRVHLTDGGLSPNHEDLRGNPLIHLVESQPNDDPVHGTASAGILVASANGLGATGICHESALYLYQNRAPTQTTLQALMQQVIPGDVVVFNREVADPLAPDTRLPTLHSWLWWDAMKQLVERGAVVVCAAGNGHKKNDRSTGAVSGRGVDLGSWRYFDNHGDAGAIVVGACESRDGTPSAFSNYNYPHRMLNAWGDEVVTLGAVVDRDLQDLSGTDRDYTDYYSGTSAATPMVAGALSLIQSYAMQQHHIYLNSDQMHLLVSASGYQDATLPQHDTLPMGVRPNVHGALDLLDRILGGGRFHNR